MSLPEVTYPSGMPTDRLMRIEELAAQIEAPHSRIVYGRSVQVRPTFCRAVIGDGTHLLIVTAVRTAPAYHAILIDSSWVRPATGFRTGCGPEADLDDPERRDLIADTLVDMCGDGDRWHEDEGEEHVTPQGLFCRDMGFYYGLEPLGPDGMIMPTAKAA